MDQRYRETNPEVRDHSRCARMAKPHGDSPLRRSGLDTIASSVTAGPDDEVKAACCCITTIEPLVHVPEDRVDGTPSVRCSSPSRSARRLRGGQCVDFACRTPTAGKRPDRTLKRESALYSAVLQQGAHLPCFPISLTTSMADPSGTVQHGNDHECSHTPLAKQGDARLLYCSPAASVPQL